MALFLRICAGVGEGGVFGGAHSNREFSLGVSKMLLVALGFFGGGGGLGASESPSTMLTRQYSIKAMKTKLKKQKEVDFLNVCLQIYVFNIHNTIQQFDKKMRKEGVN